MSRWDSGTDSTRLGGTIDVETSPAVVDGPLWIRLTVTNETDSPVSVVDPYVGTPPAELNWSYPVETYRAAVLLSFHYLTISMTTDSGMPVPIQGPNPWVTPLLAARTTLEPGSSLSLRIELSDFFRLSDAGRYTLTIRYGDDHASATAEAKLLIEKPSSLDD